jgi:hypothetical protein
VWLERPRMRLCPDCKRKAKLAEFVRCAWPNGCDRLLKKGSNRIYCVEHTSFLRST